MLIFIFLSMFTDQIFMYFTLKSINKVFKFFIHIHTQIINF